MHKQVSRVAVRYLTAVAVIAFATATLYSQQSSVRQELQEMRRDFGLATEALRQFDEQMKTKDYGAATSTLEEAVKLKAKLEKTTLPSVIKRTVAGWETRIQEGAKALEAAGVKLPDSLKQEAENFISMDFMPVEKTITIPFMKSENVPDKRTTDTTRKNRRSRDSKAGNGKD